MVDAFGTKLYISDSVVYTDVLYHMALGIITDIKGDKCCINNSGWATKEDVVKYKE